MIQNNLMPFRECALLKIMNSFISKFFFDLTSFKFTKGASCVAIRFIQIGIEDLTLKFVKNILPFEFSVAIFAFENNLVLL